VRILTSNFQHTYNTSGLVVTFIDLTKADLDTCYDLWRENDEICLKARGEVVFGKKMKVSEM
jgi:hypothetical protein